MKSSIMMELGEVLQDYPSIPRFLEEYSQVTLPEFDYYVVNKMSLFLVHENYDFDEMEQIIEKMENVLPSMKRIFQKPIIHLKEEDEIVPVEAVKLVNTHTIQHISTHSELWDDINEEGIKPVKLLTRTYRDNYSIYENIVFARTVDCCLAFLRKNMRFLRTLMYSNSNLEFNLLERVNHIDYFLAIGKLHTGYIRDFSKYYDISKRLYTRMSVLYDTLQARLKRNVYRLNKRYTQNLQLHNSNILLMQKDYHKVYVLLKHFTKTKEEPYIPTKEEIRDFNEDYFAYIEMITLFAAMHFNFEAKRDLTIDFYHMDYTLSFKEYTLHVYKNKDGLVLEFHKEVTYTILLMLYYRSISEGYDEIIRVSPMDSIEGEVISITDIDSFRKIERIMERGMAYSSASMTTCMFCGEKFHEISKEGEDKTYLCNSCRTILKECQCDIHKKKYLVTSIDGFVPKKREVLDSSELFHYRNITDVTKDGDFICPHCHKTHKVN